MRCRDDEFLRRKKAKSAGGHTKNLLIPAAFKNDISAQVLLMLFEILLNSAIKSYFIILFNQKKPINKKY